MIKLFLLPLFFIVSTAFSQERSLQAPANTTTLFTFEKNENPENILIVYTQLNSDCTIQVQGENNNLPIFDFYWRMERTTYKPTHPLIKSGIQNQLQLDSAGSDPTRFYIKLNDFGDLNHDLADPRLLIKSEQTNLGCTAQVQIRLGKSQGNTLLQLKKIYAEAKTSFLPPFRKLISVTLSGTDIETGATVLQTFYSKNH